MKVTADRKALGDALKQAAKFLPRMSSLQALSNFLIEAHSGIVAITATDLEAGRRLEVEAEVKTEGRILAGPALAGIVNAGVGEQVVLSATAGANLSISIEKSSWRLPLGRLEDYPESAEPEIEGDKLPIGSWERIRAVTATASTDTARPVLMGVCLAEGTAVTTDSYRLSWVTFTESDDHPEALVPARAIASVSGPTDLLIGDRSVKATLDDGAWWGRLIAGAFPKWRSLVPADEPTCRVSVNTEALRDSIGRASLVSDNSVPIKVTVEPLGLNLSMHTGGEEVFSELVAAEVQGEIEPCWYSPAYLRSILEAEPEMTLHMQDPVRPLLVKGEWFTGMIMPVRR